MNQEKHNIVLLLLLAIMFIGTHISTAIGAGLMIGAGIVTLWNSY